MSLLLKGVWRSVLRTVPLNRPSVQTTHSKQLSSGVPEVSRARSPDLLMAKIKSAHNTDDVLTTVQACLPVMTHKHMLQALRCLFELHKAGHYHNDVDSLTKNPAFSVLCQTFKKHARALDVGEAIEATKVLSFLGVSVDSLIVQTMLQMIRSQINTLNLRQIMFLDFILTRFNSKNHLVDALKLALPLAFQIHLPFEMDSEDLPLLKDVLAYAVSHDLPDRFINNVVTALLLHDHAIDHNVAKSVIWSLCMINCTEERFPTRIRLLHICYDVLTLNMNMLTYDEVLRTAAKIKGRILEKHPEYYHERLMDAVANYVVMNEIEFEKGLLVARVLSRIAHTHLGLVERLCAQAASSPDSLANARTNILFGFINCLANTNYTPDHQQWLYLRQQISQNPVLNARSSALPWSKVCLELASLGHFEDKLLARVFSEEFLEEHLSRENNTLDYLQLLTLQEAVHAFHSQQFQLPEHVLQRARDLYPVHALTEQLEDHLARGLGGSEYVVRNVVLPSGIVADVVLALKSGYPVKLPQLSSNCKLPLAELCLPPGAIVVCIMNFNQGCFSMNSNRLRGTFRLLLDVLEKQGFAAVPVNVNEWLSAPAHERTPYLLREVGYKCGEIGIKLSAT